MTILVTKKPIPTKNTKDSYFFKLTSKSKSTLTTLCNLSQTCINELTIKYTHIHQEEMESGHGPKKFDHQLY